MTNDPNPRQQTKTRLLLIEDDELSRELLTLQIAAGGYLIDPAESGDDALRMLAHTTAPFPDIILTDLQMPGICGLPLAHKLRQLARQAGADHTVLLAMSATAPTHDLIPTFDAFLLKPFTLVQLSLALEEKAVQQKALQQTEATARPRSLKAVPLCLDRKVYHHLVDAIPAEQLQQLYTLFLTDIDGRVEKMRGLALVGNDADYRREAHAIKGASSMVGAIELQRLAAKVEQQGIPPANHVVSLDELLLASARLRRMLLIHP